MFRKYEMTNIQLGLSLIAPLIKSYIADLTMGHVSGI